MWTISKGLAYGTGPAGEVRETEQKGEPLAAVRLEIAPVTAVFFVRP